MKKFLSLILALTLVASLFTVNVMAASVDHTATITVTKADGSEAKDLVAGDKVVVTVTIDGTMGLKACGYALEYDEDVFSVDTTMGEYYENYIDPDWYYECFEDTRGAYKNWAKALGTPTYVPTSENAGEAGVLKYAWASSSGVASDMADFVIGKFTFTVKENAVSGEYSFAFEANKANSYTTDDGQDMRLLPSNTAKAKVGADAPVVPDEPEVTVPEAAADALTGGVAGNAGENYDNAAMTTATFTNIADIVKVGVLFMPTELLDGELNFDTPNKANAEYAGELSALGEGSYTLKAALRGIPRKYHAGIGITSRAYAIYGDNAVKYADEKAGTIKFAATAE